MAPGVVAEDDRIAKQIVFDGAAPQGAFRGDAHRVRVDPDFRDPQAFQVRHPGAFAGEATHGGPFEEGKERSGKLAGAHIGQRRPVDHVVFVAGPQKTEKVQAALGKRRTEPGKTVVADLGAYPVAAPVPGTGIIDAHPGRRLQARAQNVTAVNRWTVSAWRS